MKNAPKTWNLTWNIICSEQILTHQFKITSGGMHGPPDTL